MFGSGRRRSFSLILLASTALSSPALALDPSGSAVRVDRLTDAAGPGGNRVLEDQGPVYMGDEITTDPNGLAQVRFVDDTRIVIGPNSRLVVDTFVFNPDNTAQEVTVDAVKGFFRFISGDSPDSAYTIRTPTMSIGIRGTILDIHSNAQGSRAAFLQGSGDGCDAANVCIPFEGGCRIYEAPVGGGFDNADGRLDRQLQISAYFPFIGDQSDLDPAFRADTSDCAIVDNRLFQPPPDWRTNEGTDTPSPPPPSPPPPPPQDDNGDGDDGPGDDSDNST